MNYLHQEKHCNRKRMQNKNIATCKSARWDSAIHKKSATRKKCKMKRLLHKKGHIGKVGPGTRDVYRQDPETPKCLGGTQNWDPQSGTRGPKISKWNPGISIVYSTLYTSLVTKLCINLFIRLTYSWQIYRYSHYDVV